MANKSLRKYRVVSFSGVEWVVMDAEGRNGRLAGAWFVPLAEWPNRLSLAAPFSVRYESAAALAKNPEFEVSEKMAEPLVRA